MTNTSAEILLLAVVNLTLLAFTFMTPVMMPLTRPYGVRVPLNLVAHPALPAAHKAFRGTALGAGTTLVALSLVAGYLLPASTPVFTVLAPFLFLAVTALAARRAARLLRRSKEQENWYADRATGITFDIREQVRRKQALPRGWFYASAALIALTALVLAVRYPHLPDPYPVHYNALGEADAWDDKTIINVFLPVGSMIFTLASIVLAFYLVTEQSVAQDGEQKLRNLATKQRDSIGTLSDALGITAADYMNLRQRLTLQKSMEIMGPFTFALTLGIGYLTVLDPLGAPAWLSATAMPIFLALVLGGVLAIPLGVSLSTRHLDASMRAMAERGTTDITQLELPDTDRHYKAGILYANREDPRIFVPRTIGSGYSLNWGNPLAYAVFLAILAPAIVVIALAALS